MSQPFVSVAIHNSGPTTCSLAGYPGVVAYALRGGVEVPAWINVVDSAIYERTDPGIHTVNLAPGGDAWFDLGTGMAYPGATLQISYFVIYPPGLSTGLILRERFGATAPVGEAFPITVTALHSPAPQAIPTH